MSKFHQQEAPDQIWIQPLDADSSELSEPLIFSESDDWYGHLFNAYFLGSLRADQAGIADNQSPNFPELQELLQAFFQSGSLTDVHRQLATRWFENGMGPDISGTWFTVSWKDFQWEDYSGPAIGFFYSGEDEPFLNLGGGEAQVQSGLPLKKPTHSCLIYEEGEKGFRMHQQYPQPAGFWSKELFPFHAGVHDDFHSREFFKMCKSFSEDVLVKEQKKSREDQVEFLSDSLSFAKENKELAFDSFRQEVLKEPSLIDAFDEYKENYSERKQWNPPDRFAVSESVQNQAGKYIRSIIKLDKNFHIYVHGARERIEKGFDRDKNLNYYTLWFDAES